MGDYPLMSLSRGFAKDCPRPTFQTVQPNVQPLGGLAMVSVSPYLYRRGKTYYFVIKIPSDIKTHFDNKNHIVKSLKTKDISDARIALELIRSKTKLAFLLIRSGLLTEDQLQKSVSELSYKKSFHCRKQTEKKLSDVITIYLDEKTPNLKDRTIRDYKVIFSKIVSIIGDKELTSYSRTDAIHLRSTLRSEELKERSCNKHLVHLSSLLKWAVRLDLCKINFAEGLLLEIHGRQDSERKRFDTLDLYSIFSTIPVNDNNECNLWIPLIALYSGMRREEICQLERSDIRQEDDIWVFDINDKGKKTIKTKAGCRFVPIHSKLIDIGFLQFCEERAKGRTSGNLWGFLLWRESWGKVWGGWFNHWLSTYVKPEKGKCFHSFRHTVTDELKQAGENKELVAELIGHAVKDITFGRYGKRHSVKNLKAAIEKLTYEIDLSRINDINAERRGQS